MLCLKSARQQMCSAATPLLWRQQHLLHNHSWLLHTTWYRCFTQITRSFRQAYLHSSHLGPLPGHFYFFKLHLRSGATMFRLIGTRLSCTPFDHFSLELPNARLSLLTLQHVCHPHCIALASAICSTALSRAFTTSALSVIRQLLQPQ